LTTRGLGKKEFLKIAKIIDLALQNYQDKKIIKSGNNKVYYLSQKFTLKVFSNNKET
jgi:glycine/serine hydroxymethyltransferase